MELIIGSYTPLMMDIAIAAHVIGNLGDCRIHQSVVMD